MESERVMRIHLVTANAQEHNEYIEYRDQTYDPGPFTDTPMHMGETPYTAGFVSIMGVYTTREQAETRATSLPARNSRTCESSRLKRTRTVGGSLVEVGSGEQADNHSRPSERHALGQANHHQQLAWHRRVRQAEKKSAPTTPACPISRLTSPTKKTGPEN